VFSSPIVTQLSVAKRIKEWLEGVSNEEPEEAELTAKVPPSVSMKRSYSENLTVLTVTESWKIPRVDMLRVFQILTVVSSEQDAMGSLS
jgi:hypothetical protein